MRLSNFQMGLLFIIGVTLGYFLSSSVKKEGFQDSDDVPICSSCGEASCPPMPDMSKYIMKSSIPPPTQCPDMSMYMLKTECPPAADLSHYVLKSSIPKPEPIIIDNSSCSKNCGDCPPCPRPRCPEINCPAAPSCPACAPCARQKCPEKTLKCKSEDADNDPVRPYLTPLSVTGFGSA